MKKYQQLQKEERFYIHQAVREGKTQQQIAERLNRHPSTISRELRRNMWPSAYLYTYEWALYFVRQRKRFKCKHMFRKLTQETQPLIIQLLKKYLSPEQVCAYLERHHGFRLSHETVYRFIDSDPQRKAELRPYLRQGKKRYRKRYGSGPRNSLIPNRISIDDRPKVVARKTRLGDWEGDTVIGKDRKSALVTLVDRKSLYALSAKVTTKSAEAVSTAIIKLLMPYKKNVKTLTFDNGSEFFHHERIARVLSAKTYFAHPYSSWERGINENTNGLLRQFFPKGTDFNLVTHNEVKKAIDLLNNRPRKTRKYKTPNEIFNKQWIPLIAT